MIEAVDISVRRGDRVILGHLTWRLGPGDRVALVGVTGAGKTTLMRALSGELPVESGEVDRGSTVKLAFLSQESDLGKNVGQCLVTDLSTGNGKGKNTGTPFKGVKKAPRDTVPFQAITSALAIDWSAQPVSCPQSVGYGGAMGPAQFIPSTWQLYAPRIGKALGIGGAEPDPWNAQAAIMANALYIADLGAGAGTYTAEKSAACHYFSGQSCGASATINGYGVSVVNKADAFQADIDCLNNNATCTAS